MKKYSILLVLSCIVLTSCTLVSNARLVEIDSRNKEVPCEITKNPFSNSPVFNLKKGTGFSKADVMRCLFMSAEELKDKTYDKVYLSNNGKNVFYITGEYFKKLGKEYSNGENPVYLDRTFPENVYNLEGEKAYSSWEGGIFGVTSKQMDDLNDLLDKLID